MSQTTFSVVGGLSKNTGVNIGKLFLGAKKWKKHLFDCFCFILLLLFCFCKVKDRSDGKF